MYSGLPDYANAEVMLPNHQRSRQFRQQPQHHPRDVIVAAKQSPTLGSAGSNGGGGGAELDERAGRFASALLLLAALVLAVDASRLAMFSWYSEGAYLRFTYGDRGSVTWPRCGAAGPGAAMPVPLPPPQPPPPAEAVALGRSEAAAMRQAITGDDVTGASESGETWLSGAKRSVMVGVLLTGEALGAGFVRPRPRPPPKPLAIGLSHIGPAACVCLLLTAALPACLRSPRPSRCALALAVALALASIALAAVAVSACIVKIYLFTLCEIAAPRPTPQFSYDALVPPCPLLRKAFFCAECFSLLVLIASASMSVCLLAFFSRALCCRRSAGGGRRTRRRRCHDNSSPEARDGGCSCGECTDEADGSYPV